MMAMRMTSGRRWATAAILAAMPLLLAAGAASGQMLPRPEGWRVALMPYDNASGELGRSEFHYGRDGRLLRVFWTLEDGTRWSGNHFVYDADGRLVEQRRAFSDSLTSLETYRYDDAGRLAGEKFSRSDGPTGTIEYAYDDAGRLAGAACRQYKGWLTCDLAYEYAGDRLVHAVISKDGEPKGEIRYTYDDQGRRQQDTWDFGGRWSQSFHYVYEPVPAAVWTYASPLVMQNPGARVTAETYTYDGSNGGPSHYRYDEAGRLVEKIFERSDGVRTVTTYEHAPDGTLRTSLRRHADGTETRFAYAFDARGQLTDRRGERSDGAVCRETYRYDEMGRLVGARYDAMDFWLTGDLTFAHDERGHLTGGRFTGDRDADGKGFDADLTMTTDAVGNVTGVRWDFDFGAYQEYGYTYAPAAVSR